MESPQVVRKKLRNTPEELPKVISLEDFLKYKQNKVFMYVKDIKHTLKHYGFGKELKGKKKHMLEDMLNELFSKFENVNNSDNIEKITKIQALYRARKLRTDIKLYGIGILDRSICNNVEDFYTFEPINEIKRDYFYSFKDIDGFVYGFDIRSFKKLIETKSLNPYNRAKIPDNALERFNKRVEFIIKNKINLYDFEPDELTAEQKLKNRVLEVFQKIDELNTVAGGTNVQWFLGMNFGDLKNYYKLLEDIWNYRANLSHHDKHKIVPQNDMFQTSMSYIMNLHESKEKKLKLHIINEIDKLVSSSEEVEHRTTGAYYVLTAFAEMVPECAQALPWLVQDGF